MIPDKIYLTQDKDGLLDFRFEEKSVNNGYKDIEYIRKDAVMEILATLKRSMANDTSYFALGATDAANILIDKINSM